MSDDEVIFKNPFRGRRVAAVAKEPYQPEYERLGVEPIKYPLNKEDDENFIKKTASEKHPPATKIVQTGNSQETLWNNPTQEEVKGPEPPPEEDFNLTNIDNGQYVLVYDNDILCIGTKEYVEEYVTDLISNNSVEADPLSHLAIFKRVGLKAGVFLDEG